MTIETDYAATTDFAKQSIGRATDAASDAAEAAGIDKSLIARAQEAIEQAVETTVGAVKDNPVAAAAIVGGVAAVAAGAAYGISKLSGAASDDGVAKTVGKSATAAKAE